MIKVLGGSVAYVVDGHVPVPGPPGPAGTAISGELVDPSQLPPTGALGEAWLISGDLWLWDGTEWENTGSIEGPAGPTGPPGPPTPVAVPFDQWPPATPEPGTLYLRLAP